MASSPNMFEGRQIPSRGTECCAMAHGGALGTECFASGVTRVWGGKGCSFGLGCRGISLSDPRDIDA